MTERVHVHNWDSLSPAVRAAIERGMAKVRTPEELDPERCRRLASLLGLDDQSLVAGAPRPDRETVTRITALLRSASLAKGGDDA